MFNRYRSKWGLALSLVLSASLSMAQRSDRPLPLNLKSGTIFLTPNVEGPTEWTYASDELINGKLFRVIQFSELPTEIEKAQLSALGVSLIEYLPKNGFVAEIPTQVVPLSLAQLGVKAVHPMPLQMKIDKRLVERPLPAHAINGSKVKIQLIIPTSVSLGTAAENLQQYGFKNELTKSHVNVLVGEVALASVEQLAGEPWVRYVDVAPEPGEKESDDGRNLHRSNSIDLDGYIGRQYDGDGISVAVNDDGSVGPHIDFTGRVDQSNITNELGTHGDMVAGIVGGAGNLNPIMRGMAPACFMHIRQYSGNLPGTVPLHTSQDVLIFSSSYSNGCNAGYTTLTRTVDQEIYDNPTLIQVFSAGNSNNNDCGYGAGNQWGNITGGHKMGKNVIATANLDNQDNLRNSSSRGPADDGRIKPEISAHGHNQMSTDPNNTYAPGGGTSAAAPGITGCMTQLHQAYRELNGGVTAPSSLLKACVLNTANELGTIGPDFLFGFGKVNTLRALRVLEDGRYEFANVSQGGSNTHTFTIPANTSLAKVMVYWHDKEASTSAVTALVNNLDASISDGSSTFLPYVLNSTPNPTTLDDPATFGVDSLNNIEQIALTNPTAGTYTLTVNGTAVPFGPQEYVIVYEYISTTPEVTFPIGGEGLEAGTLERIHWDANVTSGNFTIEYSTDNGTNWNNIGTVGANTRFINWTIPNIVTGQAKVRVTHSGGLGDESDYTFSIIGVPQNLQVDYACPDTIAVSWNPVTGATGYDVFVLGNRFMDSVATTTTTQAFLTGYSPNDELWISVRAKSADAIGRRAIAINKQPGTFNCILPNDMALDAILNPEGTYPLCQITGTTLPVEVLVRNNGTSPVVNPSVSYSLGGAAVITESINVTLAPGASINYTFQNGITLSTQTTMVEAWVNLPTDGNNYNDTIVEFVYIEPSSGTQNYPYAEDFESFFNCATTSNCEQTNCSLINGWSNLDNGQADDVDWRTNNGNTPSNNTGPSTDALPGTAAGKYLYLEASGDCEFQEAQLLTPCVDLASAVAPELRFSYHMFGFSMGQLHVDILADGVWHVDVIQPLVGNQGFQWLEQSINLAPFIGQTINVRFRGITGGDYASDISIDAISIQEATIAPLADFEALPEESCVGEAITLVDLSTNAPNQLQWNISPATYQFVNGTSASSLQPIVEFTQSGLYTVELIASNPLGSDSIIKQDYIAITTGQLLPVNNDFQISPFPGQGFGIENPDNNITWQIALGVTGVTGNSTNAARINNFNYNDAGQEDVLVSPVIDLTNSNGALLQFDLAYAQFQPGSDDELVITVSDDCGNTFNNIVYSRSGATLATEAPTTTSYQPTSANSWRTETVDLSPYAGSSIQIRFIAITDYGNDLYLDNINVIDNSTTAAFIEADTIVCVGDTLWIEDASQGPSLNYNWTFQDGTPATASSIGPHPVVFNSVGTKIIDLAVSGPNGNDATTMNVEVVDIPIANFTATYNTGTGAMDFVFTGQYAGSVAWDFGDGATGTGTTVSHTYSDKVAYSVDITVTNACGETTARDTVFNYPTGVNEASGVGALRVFPNPFNGEVRLQANGWDGSVAITVFDLSGKILHQQISTGESLTASETIQLDNLAPGVYILRVDGDKQSSQQRIVKY